MKDGAGSFVWNVVAVTVIACTFLLPSDSRAQLEGTARDYFGPAEALATAWHPDAALRYMLGAGEEMHIAGETMVWTYLFESSMDDSLLMVAVTLGFPVGLEVSDTLSILDPLPDNWIDSDAAVAVAEANGGGDFRQNTGSDLIIAAAGRGLYLLELQRAVWMFTYSDTTTFLTTIVVYVDAVSGEWIDTQGVGIGSEPGSYQGMPKALTLSQNYPNPFNPSTTLRFTVPEGGVVEVSLEIFDVRGRRIKTLYEGERDPGTYEVHWDGKCERGLDVAGGIFLAKLRSKNEVLVRKMTLVK